MTAEPWLALKGRVIGQGRLARYPDVTPSDHLALLVASARLGARASVTETLGLEVELELAGKPAMKDAYAQHETRRTLVRVGQFKMPSLIISAESPWSLPLARRGTINDVLVDYLLVAGRRPGVMGQWRGGGPLDPMITVGAFQGSTWSRVDDNGRPDRFDVVPINELGTRSLKPVLRLDVSPAGISIGSFVEARPFPVADGVLQYQWAAGADVKLDKKWQRHGLRLWVEGTAGRSWADGIWWDADLTSFASGRAVAAWRWGGRSRGERYIEPFASVNVLDPDTQTARDLLVEVMAGVNVGVWKRARVGVEVSTFNAGPDVPPFALWVKESSPSPLREHKTILAQAGVAF